MAGAESVWGEAARRYPEVVAVGDVSRAWQAEFDQQGTPLRAHPREGVNPHRRTTVENGESHADLLLDPWQRRFYLALRTGRSTLMQGYAADLATAAGAARSWLSGVRPGQVAAAWPFLGSVALAQARERGELRSGVVQPLNVAGQTDEARAAATVAEAVPQRSGVLIDRGEQPRQLRRGHQTGASDGRPGIPLCISHRREWVAGTPTVGWCSGGSHYGRRNRRCDRHDLVFDDPSA